MRAPVDTPEAAYLRRPVSNLLQCVLMKNGLTYFLVGGLLCVACGCGSSKSCTLIGCSDQFVVEVTLASGLAPLFSAQLDIDGRAVECPSPAKGESATCDTGVAIGSYERHSCTSSSNGGIETLGCEGNGYFTERIIIVGAPKSVGIKLMTGTTVAAEKTFEPSYVTNQPNGPGCDPICHQASDAWTPF
jgi:hypothetical protein